MSNIEEDIKVLKQAERKKDEAREAEPKNVYHKVLFKLSDFTGNEQTAKLIIGLLVFSSIIVLLLMIAVIFGPKSRRPRGAPVPTPPPSPTPIDLPPTPQPIEFKQGGVDELIRDLDAFDVEQKDLFPPELDLEIGL